MKFLRSLGTGLIARRGLKILASIDARLAEQNSYLKRLADHFAPSFDHEPAPQIHGIDFINTGELGTVQDYIDKTQRDTGKAPSDEEILRYLEEEAHAEPQA